MRCPQFLQLFVDIFPVVLKVSQYLRKRLREGCLQVRVVIQLNVEVVTNRVLHLRCFCLCAATLSNILLEVLVENRNRFDLLIQCSVIPGTCL